MQNARLVNTVTLSYYPRGDSLQHAGNVINMDETWSAGLTGDRACTRPLAGTRHAISREANLTSHHYPI
jgi:hypothetical protein